MRPRTAQPAPRLRPWSLATLASALVVAGVGYSGSANAAEPIDVNVDLRGDTVVVDVTATVNAPPSVVWGVLTDYAHMANFLSSIKTSTVVGGQGSQVNVEQTGEARHGLLHFSFYTLREIDETPQTEIRSHLIKGDFKTYDLTTRLSAQGSTTVITQHGEYIPNTWVPPGIGPSAIKEETIKGYGEMIAEIMKRENASPPAAAAAQPAPVSSGPAPAHQPADSAAASSAP